MGNPWVKKIPWRRKWQPIPVFLPGESHGQRSLMGYSPWGCKQSDIISQLSTHIGIIVRDGAHTHTHTHTHTQKSLSHVQLFATPWIVAHQAPGSMGFSRHEYWSGLPFPSPRDRAGARKVQRRYLSIFGVGEVEVSAMIYRRNRLLTRVY